MRQTTRYYFDVKDSASAVATALLPLYRRKESARYQGEKVSLLEEVEPDVDDDIACRCTLCSFVTMHQ